VKGKAQYNWPPH